MLLQRFEGASWGCWVVETIALQSQNLTPELRPNVAKLLTGILRKTWIPLNLNHPLPEKFKCSPGPNPYETDLNDKALQQICEAMIRHFDEMQEKKIRRP